MRKLKKNKNNNPKKSKTHQKKGLKIHKLPDFKEKKISGKDPLENFFIISENSSEIIYHISLPEGRFEYVSPAALDITGYTPEDFYRKPWFIEDIIHPLFRDQLIDTKNKLAGGEVPPFYEFPIIHRSGVTRWLHQRFNILRDEQGHPEAIEGVVTDVTERKEAEEKLRDTRERYRLIVENANEGIAIIQGNYFVFVNPKCCEISGYSEQELGGRPFDTFLHPDDRELLSRHKGGIQSGNIRSSYTLRIITKSGVNRWLEVRTVKITWEGTPASLNFFNDITENKENEEEEKWLTRFSLRTHKALLQISKMQPGDPDEFFRKVAEIDATTLGIARVSFWRLSDDRSEMVCYESYDRTADRYSCRMRLKRADYPRYFKELDNDRTIAATDALNDERTTEFTDTYLVPLGITSKLDVPIRQGGQIAGIISHEHTGLTREWSVPEQDFVASVADLVASFLERFERRIAEQALAESEERFRSLIQNSTDIIRILDRDQTIIYDSPSSERILGYPPGSVIGKHPVEFIHPDDRDRVRESLDEVYARTNPGAPTEFRIRKADGHYIPVEAIGVNLTGVAGVDGIVITTRPVLERKRAEDALRESEERYRNVVEDQTEFICRFTSDGRLTFVNDAYCKYFGLDKQACIGRHHCVVIPADDARLMKEHLARLTPANPVEIIEHRIVMPSGEIRWQRWSDRTIFDKDGRVVEYQSVGRDTTDKKLAEEALRNSERQLADIINFIPDATFAIDRERKIIAWNRAIEKMTGVSAQDMLGRGDHEYGIPFYGEKRPILIDLVLKEDEEIKKKYTKIEKKGDQFISEIFIERLYDGKGAHLWFIASPLYDTQSNVIGAIESIRDVSDRKQAEEALRTLTEELADKVKERTSELEKTNLLLEDEIRYHQEAEHKIQQSLDEKVILLREIHHRVKNNLQIIISILNLQSRYVKDAKSLEALRDCQNRVKAMAMVHERLYQTHDISKINVAGYIRDITQILFHFYGFSLKSISLDIDVENMFVDINTAIPMGLIINELFSNALKYAFPEGRTGRISLNIKKDGDIISVVFTDDGVGIPADLDWRNSQSLGLKLVISLVEQLMGTIELHRDRGTRFDILLKEKKSREV
ncbi:MAG: PAS domain S-box protein [Methanoregula sp.]|nr:MAG: PAS domain S-box protein [Methanoregula sp.]